MDASENFTNCLIALLTLVFSLFMYMLMSYLSRIGGGAKSKKALRNYFIFLIFSSPTFVILFCISAYKVPYDLGFFHF
mgnify:FL=1